MNKIRIILTTMALLLLVNLAQADEEKLKPFTLASKAAGDVATVAAEVRQKLTGAGFEVAGEYSPYETATIIIVTNDAMKQAAAKSEFGGYGASQRVSITKAGDEVQVAYTNPVYWANAFRLQDEASASATAAQLEMALGKLEDFGSAKGLTEKKIRKYHYMFGMEYFDDPSELEDFDSYAEAVKAVESGLAAGKGGVTKVYRIDIPGKDETVFGVAIDNSVECSGDAHIMGEIDFKPLRSTAHLPYEILVSGDEAYALYARFRIAISFPDLSMMGSNSFMSIMCAPGAIESALEKVVSDDDADKAANDDDL